MQRTESPGRRIRLGAVAVLSAVALLGTAAVAQAAPRPRPRHPYADPSRTLAERCTRAEAADRPDFHGPVRPDFRGPDGPDLRRPDGPDSHGSD
ncbi:hypothetical protein ACFQ51_48125 [Streptomyces kaempferi]